MVIPSSAGRGELGACKENNGPFFLGLLSRS